MAARSDSPEPAVDELRRRARRRLVGAVVLALAAAVVLPLLLESEPRPLGDDVSIQIPPIDSGKFINPLSSGQGPDPKVKSSANGGSAGEISSRPTSGQAQPMAIPAAKQGALESETATPVTPAAPKPAMVAAAPAQESPATPAQALPDSKPAAAAAEAPAKAEKDTAAQAAAVPAATAKTDSAKTGAGYVVQIGAFSDSYGARALAAKLQRGGFPGYAETVTTDKGTLHRVRVGPYPSRDAADAALVKLKAAGFSGMVAHVG